jgi:hypothetical protein
MPTTKSRRQAQRDAEIMADAFADVQRKRATKTPRGKRAEITNRPAGGSVLHRCRRQLAPHLVLAALGTLAGIANLAADLSGQRAAVVAITTAVGFGVVAIGASVIRKSLPRKRRNYYTACALIGAAWLGLAAAYGLTGDTAALLLVAEVTLAARHWQRVRIPNPTSQPIDGQGDVPEDVHELWAAHVGDDGGVLKGARLLDRGVTEHGERYTVQLVPGRQTLGKSLGVLPEISSGLRRPLDELVLEAHPCADPSRLQLQVITRSPIKDTVFFDAPCWVDGCIHLGPYADGQGSAELRVYTSNSMWGGFVLGGTGSGKSRLLESVVVTCRSAGNTAVFYLDGQDGASSPMLARHANWFGGTEDATKMLHAIERIMKMRSKYNNVHELSGFTPSAELPGILVIVDECHEIFSPNNAERWANVARAGRKVGVAVLAASQYSGLPTFGGDEALRSSLISGNAIALRTASRTAGQLIPGLTLDPAELPELPGFGYTVAAKGSNGRTAPFRNRYMPDAKDREEDPTIPVPTVQEWMEHLDTIDLDSMSTRAAGRDFLERHEIAAQRRQADLAEIGGISSTEETVASQSVEDEQTGELVTFTEPLRTAVTVPADLAESAAAVFTAVAGGSARPVEIGEQVELSERRIRQLLGELVEAGHLRRTGHGTYAQAQGLEDTA